MKKINQRNMLSATVSMLMTLAVCQSVATQASDIEIYSNAVGGDPSILLMLDTSGSMGISSLVLPPTNAYGSPGDWLSGQTATDCDLTAISETGSATKNFNAYTYNLVGFDALNTPIKKSASTDITAIEKTVQIRSTTGTLTRITYHLRGCTNGTRWQYDRLSRLKEAIIPLLASSELEDTVIMGLGQFSAKTGIDISGSSIKLIDGHSGTILVKNSALNGNHRIALAQKIASFQSLDNRSFGNGRTGVSIAANGRDYATGSTYSSSDLRKSSSSYPMGLQQYKTAGGTPTAHAYAEAAAYMMGTHTNGNTTESRVSWIYDGSMTMQNISTGKQVHFICVELGTGRTNSDFKPSGVTNDVKQCINNWPEHGGDSVSNGTINGGVYKPDGSGGWAKLDTRKKLEDALTLLNIKMSNGWDTLDKLPAGWRYGGWMKVEHEPLDIEPIVGKVWGPYANSSAYGIVAYRTNPFALTETSSSATDNLIGGMKYSVSNSKNTAGTEYLAGGSTNQCNGNGIYFLTDGAPNSTKNNMAQAIMNTTLSTSAYQFAGKPSGTGILVSPTLKSNLFTGETGGWEYIGEYAKKLRNRTDASNTQKNPKDMNIKTAVVGFGSSFSGIPKNADGTYNCASAPSDDAKNACLWGSSTYGDGGFYYAENSDDIKNSIIKFVKNVTPPFDPIATGSPTLPQDALNPLRIQPYGYYASFIPKPQETTQLWAGNLNKYHIYNGELYNSSKTIRLIKSDGSLDSTANGLWTGGMKGKLPLGLRTNTENEQFANRTIYTNRQITGTAAPFVASEANSLKKVNVASLFGTGTTALFVNDPDKNYWLNLLGYNVGATETGITSANLSSKPELRQVGAVMHSTPILLTQRGKITVSTAGALDTTDRDDYLLFGSTQGLLHVVDADTGVEKFAFAPNEMMQNQKAAFLSETSSTGGSANLFYGVDAPWTAYTQYVSKADGTLTVKSSDRTSDGGSNTDLALKGLQWVYGGLRMGGRSYYALDLSDLDSPSLKFHINPDAAVTTDANANPTTTADTNNALSYMGQSWSKPTLAYVKFGGVQKLVMFVGGGYDRTGGTDGKGYENAAYDQSTTTGGGAGVYMFDANTGALLWWTSANATAAKGAEAFTDASASTINMKYSVVSQINAIDRDNDGLVDNLYFGDLGGQAFRVDLNNGVTAKDSFATRVVRLFSEHASGGASPRFYEMPSVSVHEDNGYVAAVAFSSGNRSSPLVGTAVTGGNQAGSTVSAADGVFVVYDKDVARTDLYTLVNSGATALKTKNVTLASLNTNISTGVAVAGNNGWKYIYSSTAGVYKGMNELYAVDGMLYVNVYHRDGTGIGGTCGAGVKGDSYVYQFCLPSGKCSFNTTTSGVPNSVKLGAGILGAGLGQGFSNTNNTSLVVKRPTTLNCTTTPNLPECQEFTTTAKLRQLRWYETR